MTKEELIKYIEEQVNFIEEDQKTYRLNLEEHKDTINFTSGQLYILSKILSKIK